MDFFNQIFLDNSIKNYCIVGGTILVVLILKRYLSRYVAAVLFRLVKRFWKTIIKQNFTDLVVEPLEWFLVTFIAIFGIDKLNFPSAFHYTIYGHTTNDIASRTGTGLIIVTFIWFLLRLIDFSASVLEEKANLTVDVKDNQLIVFFRDFFKVIIGIMGVLLVIKACFNQPIGTLLTGLSIFGAALAFAAKESLENLIASFIIFFDTPFFAGDTVKVNNISGKVERIGLRSTRIRTPDKTLVTVPNKLMVDTMVDNWSMRTKRRAEIKLELAANTPISAIEKLITETKRLLETNSAQIISHSVFLKEISKNGITVVIEYFTADFSLLEFDTLKQEVNFSVKKLLDVNKIEFASDGGIILMNHEVKEG